MGASYGECRYSRGRSVHDGSAGTAHWRIGNVDRNMVARLAIPGMIGGALGAYVLATVPGDRIRPIVSAYLLVMGAVIL